MPKGSPELTNARREEIIAACENLYQTMGYGDVTIKEIAHYTSFSRPSIYNYFETKEEIFLAILQKEYWLWVAELERVTEDHDAMTRDEIAQTLARTLSEQPQILKILSMNHFDMERNSRKERVVEFKKAYGVTLDAVELELSDEVIAYPEEPYVPHPLAGVMAQNHPANAKEKHVWSTGDQKI